MLLLGGPKEARELCVKLTISHLGQGREALTTSLKLLRVEGNRITAGDSNGSPNLDFYWFQNLAIDLHQRANTIWTLGET